MRTSLLFLSPALLLFACPPPDPGTDGGSVSCPAPTGTGTQHGGSVNAAETWSAADSPHFLPYDTSIYAPLTIEPCAVVTLGADRTVTVNPNGSITANGTAAQPVLIKNVDGSANWASIRFLGGTGHFAYTTFKNGGAPLNISPDFQAALDIRSGKATLTAPDPVVFVDHVTIDGSATQGVYNHGGGAFTADSQELTITGSAAHAATFSPNLAETLPTGKYTGNAHDDVLLTDDLPSQIRWDVTLHDRGVAYYGGGIAMAGVIFVGGNAGTTATLTLEPGVVMKFKKVSGELSIDPGSTPSRGVLIARGTAAKPIVFTSYEAVPAAGDWLGIWMGGDDSRNSLDHVRIEYAGKLMGGSGSNSCQSVQMGPTSNGGALRVYHAPPSTLVTNSEFVQSATNAIDRGWRDNNQPSLLATNTFSAINLCNETMPRDMNGGCPTVLPCPK